MEINITTVGSSFTLFLDSTLLGVGSNSGDTFTFSVQVLQIEETFTIFQFIILAFYHPYYQSQAPGELIIKAAKQVMTHLQIKISLPIHNDTSLVYLFSIIDY